MQVPLEVLHTTFQEPWPLQLITLCEVSITNRRVTKLAGYKSSRSCGTPHLRNQDGLDPINHIRPHSTILDRVLHRETLVSASSDGRLISHPNTGVDHTINLHPLLLNRTLVALAGQFLFKLGRFSSFVQYLRLPDKCHNVQGHRAELRTESALRVSISRSTGNVPRSLLKCETRLQRYWHRDMLVKGGHEIQRGQRQMAFQNWVAYDRSQSSNVTVKECLTCPLLWCRCNFPDLASTLQHVSRCQYLSGGWYYCPYCCRPEQFMDVDGSFPRLPQYLPLRKNTRLRRAVSFFKHLGHKCCSKCHRSSRSDEGTCYEVGDAPIDACKESEVPELAGPGPVELSIYHDKKAYEMEQPPPPPYHEFVLGWSKETAFPKSGPRNNTDFLPDTNIQSSSRGPEIMDCVEDETLNSSMSNIYELSSHCRTPELAAQDLPKPVNPTLDPVELIPSLEPIRDDHLQDRLDKNAFAVSLPFQVAGDIFLSFDNKAISPKSQIDELRDLVHMLNYAWTKRLDVMPGLGVSCSEYRMPSLFEKGVQVLKRCYQDIVPTTFKEVFALAHIAYAASYTMHSNDGSYRWIEFFEDMLQWQHVLSEERDAHLLIAVTNLLWCHSIPSPYGSTAMATPASTSCLVGQSIPAQVQLQHPANRWKSGTIMRECSRYLDGKSPRHRRLIHANLADS